VYAQDGDQTAFDVAREGPVKEPLRNAVAVSATIDRTAAATADGAAAAKVGPGSSLNYFLC
jgi:hypothetical protein